MKEFDVGIVFRLDRMMADRKVSLGDLAERVGITNSNLSILKTGKAKAVRISTMEALCRELDPGERLAERLWSGPEPTPSGVDGIGTIPAGDGAWDTLERGLSELGFAAIELNVNRVIEILAQLVVDYAPLKNRPGE